MKQDNLTKKVMRIMVKKDIDFDDMAVVMNKKLKPADYKGPSVGAMVARLASSKPHKGTIEKVAVGLGVKKSELS